MNSLRIIQCTLNISNSTFNSDSDCTALFAFPSHLHNFELFSSPPLCPTNSNLICLAVFEVRSSLACGWLTRVHIFKENLLFLFLQLSKVNNSAQGRISCPLALLFVLWISLAQACPGLLKMVFIEKKNNFSRTNIKGYFNRKIKKDMNFMVSLKMAVSVPSNSGKCL